MNKRILEWIKQADYDMETADFMCKGGRYFYAVFMCHLAVEKALKGLYQQKLQKTPPKTHNLIHLLNKIGVRPDAEKRIVITRLNEANIATRYPDNIDKLHSNYTQDVTAHILEQTKDIFQWIKMQF